MSYMKQKSNTMRNKQKKNISTSNRAISANYKSNKNNLPQMLKDYQLFCQKYFGNTTPIASMSQERFEKVFNEEEKKEQIQDIPKDIKTQLSLAMLENDTFDFCYSSLDIEGSLKNISDSDIIEYSKEQKLGYGKNDKNDYMKRLKKLQSKPNNDNLVKEEDEENYDDEFNFKEKEEIDEKAQIDINQEKSQHKEEEEIKNNEQPKEPIKIFDDNTHNMINEETKNRQASKIQVCYKSQKCPKRLRDRIFFGYDKTENYLVWIYVDKKNPKDAKENFDIISIFCKIYSIKGKGTTYEMKLIKDLFFDNSININQIQSAIPDILEKLLKQDKEEEGNNSFEELHSEKGEEIKDEIHQSISSIENVYYDNI